MSDSRLRTVAPPAALTLASGAIMMAGGFLFQRDGWAVAGPSMIPAGPLMSVAFALARRRRADRRTSRRDRLRHIASVLIGLPSPGGDLGLVTSLAISLVTLVAGAVMVVAGYAAASWDPAVVPPLLAGAGAIITAAFIVVERADRAPSALIAAHPGAPAGSPASPGSG